MLKPSLQLRLGQQLTMTPQLQQAIRLLQLRCHRQLLAKPELQGGLKHETCLALSTPVSQGTPDQT